MYTKLFLLGVNFVLCDIQGNFYELSYISDTYIKGNYYRASITYSITVGIDGRYDE